MNICFTTLINKGVSNELECCSPHHSIMYHLGYVVRLLIHNSKIMVPTYPLSSVHNVHFLLG